MSSGRLVMCKDRKQAEESVRAGAILAFNFFSTVALINLNKYAAEWNHVCRSWLCYVLEQN